MSSKGILNIALILAGALFGLLLCFLFIILDLHELNLAYSWENIIDITKSQRLYAVSFALFPTLFGLLMMAFLKLHQKQRRILQQEKSLSQSKNIAQLMQLTLGLSHEINNPLTIIDGICLLLTRQIGKKEASEADLDCVKRLSVIRTQVTRVNFLIKKLNQLVQLLRHSPPQKIAMKDIFYPFQTKLELEKVEFVLNLQNAKKEYLIDIDGLNTALREIIDNAIFFSQKHMENAAKIICSCFEKDDKLIIIITDNGPGVSEENKKKIFDPLFTTRECCMAKGLGLAMAQKWVEVNGGILRLQSSLNGCSFLIELPLERDHLLKNS